MEAFLEITFLHCRKMYGIIHLQIIPTLPGIQAFNMTWKQILHITSIILLIPSQIRISIAAKFLLKVLLFFFFFKLYIIVLVLPNLSND